MNVNTIVFGGRYRVATYTNGKVKTIHDPVRDRTLVIKDDTPFGKMLIAQVEQMFADAEKDDATLQAQAALGIGASKMLGFDD